MADGSGELKGSDIKRAAIVSAAARVFLSSGYGVARMDEIAREAGVSKQTVYSHFGSKDALFEEIIKSKCAELVGGDDDWPLEAEDPEIVLQSIAKRYQQIVLSDNSIALFRVIVTECTRFPELAARFHRAGPTAAADRLATYLIEKGLCPDDGKAAIEAAEAFYAMLRDDLYIRRLLDMSAPPTAEEMERRAKRVAVAFLRTLEIAGVE